MPKSSPSSPGPASWKAAAHAFDMAGALKEICDKLGVGLIYKTSFDKANRTSASTARGIGLENALPIFADIRKQIRSAGSDRCA